MSIYDYVVKDQQNNDVSLKEYEGKVLLIINSATGCGFTPQYTGLESLYEKYKELAKKEDKVIFGGRLGMYKYYDMHNVIEEALNLADYLIR